MTLDEALAEIDFLGPGDAFTYQGLAKNTVLPALPCTAS
jgi:hypothetical protein